MTRASLNRRLRMIYAICFLVLAISLAARLATNLPGQLSSQLSNLDNIGLNKWASLVYEYMRDMALVFVTMVAAYLANVFQKRTKFVASLEEEWRAMVKTKTALVEFCERETTTLDDYLTAYGRMSATLDNMRIVYRNVGETDDLIGLYPYSPLHDMRRALATLDPRKSPAAPTKSQRQIVCAAIQRSFAALRETFLEELDLEEPTHGQLAAGAARIKRPGATNRARSTQKRQQKRLAEMANSGSEVDSQAALLLAEAYAREQLHEMQRPK